MPKCLNKYFNSSTNRDKKDKYLYKKNLNVCIIFNVFVLL